MIQILLFERGFLMKQFTYTIKDENGIHARPAGLLAKEAQKFTSVINLTANDRSVSIRKLLALMGMGVKQGDEIMITAEGADENEAIAKLEAFMKKNL